MSTHSPHRTADAAAGPELRLLGSFSLSVGGAALHLGSKKARALLAALALDGPLTRAALAELFWGDLGETGARSNLRKILHALRETPLAAFLDSRGELIACHMDKVDVLEFERLVAADQLEQAYQIGSGSLLDGLEIESAPWQDWLAARRARHGALLRGVQLNLAASQEALGNVRGALRLVSAVLEHDGFDEQALGEAMRLHLTLDEHQQAAALYQRFRDVIAVLDLVPSAAAQALAVRAYRGLPDPVASLPAASVLRAPLVGREAHWLALHHSATALTVLVGEPGVGKTRLGAEKKPSTPQVSSGPTHPRGPRLAPLVTR
jgi:DNA-binding SARP family transcriptional activator